MPRITLPVALVAVGLLGAGLLVATRFNSLLTGVDADPDLFNLIASALHEPPQPPRPPLGHTSLLALSPSGQAPGRETPPAPIPAVPTQAASWAIAAAQADSPALRDWLGRWVLATSSTTGDTVRLTLRRWSRRPGCPVLSTLVATSVRPYRQDHRLIGITATCPPVDKEMPANPR
jgi:hypothetical protein